MARGACHGLGTSTTFKRTDGDQNNEKRYHYGR